MRIVGMASTAFAGHGRSRVEHLCRCFVTTSANSNMSALRLAFRTVSLSRAALAPARAYPRTCLPPRAAFSAAAGLSKSDIQTRVLEVLKGFEKVDSTKVRLFTHMIPCSYAEHIFSSKQPLPLRKT
jgi:hypothetical protein